MMARESSGSIFPLTVAVQRIALEAAEMLGVNPDAFGRDLPSRQAWDRLELWPSLACRFTAMAAINRFVTYVVPRRTRWPRPVVSQEHRMANCPARNREQAFVGMRSIHR
jgi:hypothetical protein